MLTRNLSEQEWLDSCYDEIAKRSVDGGISIQDTRDGAVLVDTLMKAIGERPANVVDFATVRALR